MTSLTYSSYTYLASGQSESLLRIDMFTFSVISDERRGGGTGSSSGCSGSDDDGGGSGGSGYWML